MTNGSSWTERSSTAAFISELSTRIMNSYMNSHMTYVGPWTDLRRMAALVDTSREGTVLCVRWAG